MSIIFLYLDPGSGSLIVQALLAGVVGFVAFFKTIKQKIQYFFYKSKDSNEDSSEN
jgi:hypothetical protein